MSRDLTAAVEAETLAALSRPVLFVEAVCATSTARMWSGLGSIDWNGETWLGAGQLLAWSGVEETADVTATNSTFTLSGVPSDLISLALQEMKQGKPVRCWLGFLDEAGAVIADPDMAFAGRLDVPEILDGADTATITVTAESRLADLQRARIRRFTDQDLQTEFPGDRGLEYVPAMAEKEIIWGRPSPGGSDPNSALLAAARNLSLFR